MFNIILKFYYCKTYRMIDILLFIFLSLPYISLFNINNNIIKKYKV